MDTNNTVKVTDLINKPIDYLTTFGKAVAGVAPIAGPFLSEFIGAVSPNQRMDRLVRFTIALDQRLSDIEQVKLHSRLNDEDFTELLEEAMRQSVRATSDERREYLAFIVANGIANEEVASVESRHLLRILGEINDLEVVWLRSYLFHGMYGDEDFYNKHQHILEPVTVAFGDDGDLHDKQSIQSSYKVHLAQLGLLEPKYSTDVRRMIESSNPWEERRLSGYSITPLGSLLLRHIGIGVEDEQ